MKRLLLLLFLPLILFSSCVKEEVEPDPEEEPSNEIYLATATIGPEGGKLASEDFILSVPPGAFDTIVNLGLILDETNPSDNPLLITSFYRLEGLDELFVKPLEISMRYEGVAEEESYIALGYSYYVPEHDDSVVVDELLPAVDSMGFLKANILPFTLSETGFKAGIEPFFEDDPRLFHWNLMLRGFSKVTRVKSNFTEIRYDPGYDITEPKIVKLAGYLDEAVQFCVNSGLISGTALTGIYRLRIDMRHKSNHLNGPAFIEPELGASSFGNFAPNFKILTRSYQVKIPGKYVEDGDDIELMEVAMESVFRYVNYCYCGNNKNWLHYALINWAIDDFTGAAYIDTEDNETYTGIIQPFLGLNADQIETIMFPVNQLKRSMFQGRNLSVLITYLMNNQNTDHKLLQNLYVYMANKAGDYHPIDALLGTQHEPEYIWWPGFFRAYLEGDIREIPIYRFQERIADADKVELAGEGDTVTYLDRSYYDLSANLFQVILAPELAEDVLGEGDKLTFELGPESLNMDYVTVLVHVVREGIPVLLGEGTKVTVDDVKAMIERGDRTLFATVVNSASESPYKEDLNIELTVRILQKKVWRWQQLSIDVVADALLRSNSGSETTWDDFSFHINDQVLNLSEEGTMLTGSWLDQDPNYKYEGEIEIQIDPQTFEITGFNFWSNIESLSNNQVTQSERTEITGEQGIRIPVVFRDDNYLSHQLKGSDVCMAIESWDYAYAMYPGTPDEYMNSLVSHTCGESSQLLFSWER